MTETEESYSLEMTITINGKMYKSSMGVTKAGLTSRGLQKAVDRTGDLLLWQVTHSSEIFKDEIDPDYNRLMGKRLADNK